MLPNGVAGRCQVLHDEIKAEADRIYLKSGKELVFNVLVWSAGVRGSHILAESGFTVTPRGRVKVDQSLRAEKYLNVYVIDYREHPWEERPTA